MTVSDVETKAMSGAQSIDDDIGVPIRFQAAKRFCKNIGAVISVFYLVVITILCFFPQIITSYPQNDINLDRRTIHPGSEHLLGTDRLGRDVLTEILHGGRVSIRVAIIVALISTAIGAIVGAIAGYKGNWVDSLLMRTTDLFLVVPQIVILAIALNRFGSSGELVIGLIVALTFWMSTARFVRAQVISIKENEFIDAAVIAGRSSSYIVFRHLIPNSWNIIAVSSAFAVANAILIESTLSFLGFGVQPPNTSWGLLLDAAKGSATGTYFFLFFAPGLAIFLTVLAFNFIGDGLRDAFDPRTGKND